MCASVSKNKKVPCKAGRPAKGKSGPASEATEDAVYQARSKFERWAECYSGLYEYKYRTLVETPDGADDDDPVFEADEFALVPTRDLSLYQTSIEEAREMLNLMEEQLHAALEAREAART